MPPGEVAGSPSEWSGVASPIPFTRRERIAEALDLDPARLFEPGPVYLPAEERRFLEGFHSLQASEQAALRELVGVRTFAGERPSC